MAAKPLSEVSTIRPVRNPDGNFVFVIRLTGDKSDFSSNLDVEVTVAAGELLEYDAFQETVFRQTGMLVRIDGADDNRATWLDRLQKFLEPPAG